MTPRAQLRTQLQWVDGEKVTQLAAIELASTLAIRAVNDAHNLGTNKAWTTYYQECSDHGLEGYGDRHRVDLDAA